MSDDVKTDDQVAEQPTPQQASTGTKPVILVGVDGSEDGLRAARFAARAAHGRATVHLVHAVDDAVLAGAWGVVYDPTILQQAGERAVTAAVDAAVGAGIDKADVTSEVVLGNAASVLARLSEKASLMVLGRRSVSGLERMFVGSTSVATVANTKCPTVVISQASNPDPTGKYGVIVVGVDPGSHAVNTLKWALAEAKVRGAKVEVVHVVEPRTTGLFGRGKPSEEAKQQQIEAATQGVKSLVAAEQAEYGDVPTEVEILYGNPVDALVDRTGHSDLLVLGVQRPGPGRTVGGTVRGLMAHSQAPMCLIP